MIGFQLNSFAQELDTINPHCIYAQRNSINVGKYYDAEIDDFELTSWEDTVAFYTYKIVSLERARDFKESFQLISEWSQDQRLKEYSPFCNYAGSTCFINGEYLLGSIFFSQILKNTSGWECYTDEDSAYFINAAHLNLGSCYNRLSLWDSAIFHYEMVKINEKNEALMYNNIASLYLLTGQPEKALENLLQIDVANVSDINYEQLTKINLLACYTRLRMLDEGRKVFKSISKDIVPYSDTSNVLKIALDFEVSSSDTLNFLSTIKRAESYLVRHKGNIPEFSYALRMLEYYPEKMSLFRSYWDLWDNRIGTTKPSKKLSSLKMGESVMGLPKHWFIFVWALLFLSAGYGLKVFLDSDYFDKWMTSLTATLYRTQENPKPVEDNSDPLSSLTEEEEAFVKTLSIKETKMLRLIIQGFSTKEISVEIRCSVGYAYNLRSALRRKFEEYFAEGLTFEEWLKTRV